MVEKSLFAVSYRLGDERELLENLIGLGIGAVQVPHDFLARHTGAFPIAATVVIAEIPPAVDHIGNLMDLQATYTGFRKILL